MATALKPKEVRPCGAAAGRFGPFLTVFAYKPSEAPTGNYAKKSRVILPAMRVFEVQNPSSTKAYSHSGCEFRFWAIVGARFVSDRNRNAALHPERPLQSYARLESHSVTLVRAYAQVELGLSALLPPSLDVVDAENSSRATAMTATRVMTTIIEVAIIGTHSGSVAKHRVCTSKGSFGMRTHNCRHQHMPLSTCCATARGTQDPRRYSIAFIFGAGRSWD